MTNGRVNPSQRLEDQGISGLGNVYYNYLEPALVEAAVARGEGRLGKGGAFLCTTGQYTGRSPKDKFVVRTASVENTIWWENNAPMAPEAFDLLHADMLEHMKGKDYFVQDLFGGADPVHRLDVRVVTELAWHGLFIRHLLRRPERAELDSFTPEWTIINCPTFKADPARHGCRTTTVIALNFDKKLILIGNTAYAGENKKAVFTLLNYLLPEKGVMPMHCSANVGTKGDGAILFGLSIFAELLANDRPLVVSYRGEIHTPFLKFFSEADFGGDFRTEANYKSPEVQCLIVTGGLVDCFDEPETMIEAVAQDKFAPDTEGFHKGWILWAPIPYSYNTINDLGGQAAPSAPDANHWLGTDDTSRDVLARVIYGFRLSVTFALIVTLITSVIGIAAGAVQGYFGGLTDLVFQRVLEIWGSTPSLYVIIIVAAIWRMNFWLLVFLMVLFGWTGLVGVVRAEFLRARNFEYVRAARALGVPPRRINEIILGKRIVTADTDLRLCRYWGLSDGYWLRLQAAFDLMQQRRRMGAILDRIVPFQAA